MAKTDILAAVWRGRQAIRVAEETAADELLKKPPARSAKSRQSTRAPAQPRAGSKQANIPDLGELAKRTFNLKGDRDAGEPV
jgi:hypothetical protein